MTGLTALNDAATGVPIDTYARVRWQCVRQCHVDEATRHGSVAQKNGMSKITISLCRECYSVYMGKDGRTQCLCTWQWKHFTN